MSYKVRVNFHSRVYKDQTNGANAKKLAQSGDTIYLKKRVVGAAPVLETVTLTGVINGGLTIEFDAGTTGVRAEDIVGISAKHQYKCPGTQTIVLTITEGNANTVAMAVTNITAAGGGVFPINVEESTINNGIEEEFAQNLTDAINGLLSGTHGYASYEITGTAGNQNLVITITACPFSITAMTIAGGTLAIS